MNRQCGCFSVVNCPQRKNDPGTVENIVKCPGGQITIAWNRVQKDVYVIVIYPRDTLKYCKLPQGHFRVGTVNNQGDFFVTIPHRYPWNLSSDRFQERKLFSCPQSFCSSAEAWEFTLLTINCRSHCLTVLRSNNDCDKILERFKLLK